MFQATKIEFNPLRADLVSLPKGSAFVVCHCGVEMNKAATSYFNERVVECRIAAQVFKERRSCKIQVLSLKYLIVAKDKDV